MSSNAYLCTVYIGRHVVDRLIDGISTFPTDISISFPSFSNTQTSD
jgi:hypothetical protein